MVSTIVWGVVIAAVMGLALKLYHDYRQTRDFEITWPEYFISLLAISFVITPLIVWAGWSLSKSNNLQFNEYRNGWETQAVANPMECTRDGSCRYEYNCDPYTVMVSYECNCSTDKDGHTSCGTCWRPERRYHDCPYVRTETSYFIKTSVGDYTVAEHRFPDNPQTQRWRPSETIPDSVINRAGTGQPQFWKEVDLRIKSGKPGPATARASYDNYVLASDSKNQVRYLANIEKLLANKVLPQLSTGVNGFYSANKVYLVGVPMISNIEEWSRRLEYFNAAFGSELQGDLHLVLVNDNDLEKIMIGHDGYADALKAYWQNTKYFGNNALSKNTVVVILATSNGTNVRWARSFTGMPVGNERMMEEINKGLVDIAFNPDAIIGNVGRYNAAPGKLYSIILGLELKDTRFQRVSMTANDPGDFGRGFTYLWKEILITNFQQGMILFVSVVACAFLWMFMAGNKKRYPENYSGPFDRERIKNWWKTQWKRVFNKTTKEDHQKI